MHLSRVIIFMFFISITITTISGAIPSPSTIPAGIENHFDDYAVVTDTVLLVRVLSRADGLRLEGTSCIPGRLKWHCGKSRFSGAPLGSAKVPMLVIYDWQGEEIYRTPFTFPAAATIPPPQSRTPGTQVPGSNGPDLIYTDMKDAEVFLRVPNFVDARRIAIFQAGEKKPSSSRYLSPEDSYSAYRDIDSFDAPTPSAADDEKLHVLIIASGYTAPKMADFKRKAATLEKFILNREPFRSFKSTIAFHIYPNLVNLGCEHNCAGVKRYMCCFGEWVMNAASSSGYLFDEIIVLHNSDQYGGGGLRDVKDAYRKYSANSYCVSYSGTTYKEVVFHEFGHSFGNLCDEYTYSSSGFGYSSCVNCRENCSDWASISNDCQKGCDAKSDYFRPGNSIMLSLGTTYFNDASIFAQYMPDGLEKRLRFFAGEMVSVYIPIEGQRLKEKAWLVTREYGSIVVDFNDNVPGDIQRIVLYRKEGNGEYSPLKELDDSLFVEGKYALTDAYLDRGTSYTYKAEGFDSSGNLVAQSDEIKI